MEQLKVIGKSKALKAFGEEQTSLDRENMTPTEIIHFEKLMADMRHQEVDDYVKDKLKRYNKVSRKTGIGSRDGEMTLMGAAIKNAQVSHRVRVAFNREKKSKI